MKYQAPLALLSLAGLAYANVPHARPEFDKVCNPASTDEVEISPGLYATYHCGLYTKQTPKTTLIEANPEACIAKCASTDDCVGAVWTAQDKSKKPCHLIHGDAEPPLKTSGKRVWITYRTDEDDEPEEDPSEEELEKCQNLAARTCTNAVQNTVYTAGSKKYRVKCAHAVSAAVGSNADMRQIKDVQSFDECAEWCAQTSGCARAEIRTYEDKNTCHLFRNPSNQVRTSDMIRSVLIQV